MLMQAENFAHQTFQTIPIHRARQHLLRHDEAETRNLKAIRANQTIQSQSSLTALQTKNG